MQKGDRMKLRIEIDSELTETEIVIKAAALTDEIADLQRLLQETKAPRLIFYKGTGEYYLDLSEILFFETEGSKIYAHKLDAVISMPSGVFKHYAGVSTAILIFTKTGNGGTDKVWFYDMKADGLSLDDKRQPINENDIPDIIQRYHQLEKEVERKRTDQSFFVPVDEIKENDFDLSINKYKEIEYEKVEYEPTEVILKKINDLEKEIQAGLAELEELLK